MSKKKKNRATEIANTFEWLITAFILALVFRAFIMEAFRIPTGSMATTLKGAHFRLRCEQCGYRYDYGYDSAPDEGSRRGSRSRCPSCGHFQRLNPEHSFANGDRILVLKCIYQFAEPERWDVVVFKNPLEPSINYIKRLIAKPGETLEIIDGDIYIDNQITRKPEKVQKELWKPVFNNDYQPVRPSESSFNFHAWRQPFVNVDGSQWENSRPRDPTRFYLNSSGRQIHLLRYDTNIGNPLRATSGYNSVSRYNNRPFVSDLMVRFYAEIRSDNNGIIGADLEKYGITYTGIVDQAGRMRIYENNGSQQRELAARTIEPVLTGQPVLFRFKNVDRKLELEFAGEKLTYDLGRTADSLNYRNNKSDPAVRIRGSGELVLSHIALYRDIHYMSRRYMNDRNVARAGQGNPFTLGQDEYFMLGDNSPSSQDSRWWNKEGIGNRGKLYRKGVVPREYLVGKALWVYWPSGYKPWRNFPVGIIPNVGDMKLIYGGTGPEDADKADD